MLPILSPTVICARTLPVTPVTPIQTTELSDAHIVPSHAVAPSRPATHCARRPRLEPLIVTLTDPVPAILEARAALTPDRSTDTIPVVLPTATPTLNDARLLPTDPLPA